MTLATSPSQIPHRSIHFYTVARKLRKVAVAGELRMAFVRWPFTSFAAERFAKTNRHLGAVPASMQLHQHASLSSKKLHQGAAKQTSDWSRASHTSHHAQNRKAM